MKSAEKREGSEKTTTPGVLLSGDRCGRVLSKVGTDRTLHDRTSLRRTEPAGSVRPQTTKRVREEVPRAGPCQHRRSEFDETIEEVSTNVKLIA